MVQFIMRTRKSATLLILCLLCVLCITGLGTTAYAVTDDPGKGRLSGTDIPEEFYDNDTPTIRSYGLRKYGSSTSISPYTNLTYTHQDVFDGRSIIHGIDISQWQGATIDWNKVKAAGIHYVFIRVGGRGYGKTGNLFKDTYYEQNMQGALAAGLQVGVYIFSQAITEAEAVAEAEYILNSLGTYAVTMPLIMDFEYASDASDGGRLKTAKLSKAAATNVCLAFCNRIAQSGYTPMVYANKSMLTDQMNAATITNAGYRTWLANYTTNTTYTGNFDFWQYSSSGKVDGISGKVDMNFYYAKDTDNFLPNAVDINAATISSIGNQSYTGSAIVPAVTVTYGGEVLTPNVDYKVTAKNNKSIGTATATISGIGQFKGLKTATFKVVPKTVTGFKASTRSTNYLKLSWSKIGNVTGYQIFRSTSANGTYKKIKTIKSASTKTYKNTGLTPGKCYYYKIRGYKKVSGTTYYGNYTKVKAIYTKTGYTKNGTAKSNLTIYNSPEAGQQAYISVGTNTKMKITYSTEDASGNSWYYVSCDTAYGTYNGFVLASQVTVTMTGKVAYTNKVNVRKKSTTSSKVLTTLKRNKKVTVTSTKQTKKGNWYKVTFKKNGKIYEGWISAPYVKLQ